MRGHEVEYQNEGNVDGNGAQGVHAAKPTASLTLDIELFEEPDRNSDQNGIREPKFERAACREGGDPSEACEYSCGQQRRSDFLLCPKVKIRESSVNHSGSDQSPYQGRQAERYAISLLTGYDPVGFNGTRDFLGITRRH